MKLLSQYFNTLKRIRARMKSVLSINQRNLKFIYPYNKRSDYPIADNKLLTKDLLNSINIPVAKTFVVYRFFYELLHLNNDLQKFTEFVIKPAGGKGGGGILVISDRRDDYWLGVNGKKYSLEDIRKHISDIIFGVYSFGLNDVAIVEDRIKQHPEVEKLSPFGLADVRIIVYKHQPIIAMIRLATKDSNGTANLHQGAIGVGIDIQSGVTTNATSQGEFIDTHPDSNVKLIGFEIPGWDKLLNVSRQVSQATPLKYIGIDLAISSTGPVVLEINVRPGIEIQNANALGMRALLDENDSLLPI